MCSKANKKSQKLSAVYRIVKILPFYQVYLVPLQVQRIFQSTKKCVTESVTDIILYRIAKVLGMKKVNKKFCRTTSILSVLGHGPTFSF